MKVQDLIEMMEAKAMDEEFRNVIFDCYRKDCLEGIADAAETDYETAKSRFEEILTQEQKEMLSELERQYSESREHVACRGFKCGLYGGFRQYFTDKSDNDGGFYNLICRGRERDYEEKDRASSCLALSKKLEKELPEAEKTHLVSIDCAWQERIHNASLHGFYCGYSAAYLIIGSTDPMARMKNISKILTTEYYLGYIHPSSDLERLCEIKLRRDAFTIII